MPSQASKTELRAGSLIAGKYKLQRQLGRGASGAVWSATNVATSRQVALKVLIRPEPKARERLLREARAAGALKHPNVVDVYDVVVCDDGSPALVLEFLEGETLEQLIFERAPLPPVEVAQIGRDVARALAVAHASGIVHRDLKPANIFLHRPSEEEEPVVKVVDFGISKNLLAHEQTLTETGMAVGSPSFMSPEQVRGERNLDGRTDLWALGVIMYEMLRGKRLFDGRAHEVLTLVLTHPIKPIAKVVANIDPTLDHVVTGLLERDLGKRLASAEDVATQLASYVTAAREGAQRATEAPPASRGQPRDTSVVQSPNIQVPKASAVPRIHEDDEEEEATHVAPLAMKTALAKQTAIPSVYNDDEEEEDRTRVAPDAVLTAAIQASREPTPEMLAAESNQNAIPTVRPPGLDRNDAGEMGGSTINDSLPLTANGTQKMSVEKAPLPAAKPGDKASPKVPVTVAKPPVTVAKAPIGKAPVGPAPARPAPSATKTPIEKAPVGPAPGARSPLGQKPVAGPSPAKAPAARAGQITPPVGPGLKQPIALAPPSKALRDMAAPHSEHMPSGGSHGASPLSERITAVPSDRPPSIAPISKPVPVVGPPDADVDEEAISERSPSVRPSASVHPPEAYLPLSERSPSLQGDAEQRRASASGAGAGQAPSAPNPNIIEAPLTDIEPPPYDPAAQPGAIEPPMRPWSERSDALLTWLVTIVVAALLILAAYLYTHRS